MQKNSNRASQSRLDIWSPLFGGSLTTSGQRRNEAMVLAVLLAGIALILWVARVGTAPVASAAPPPATQADP